MQLPNCSKPRLLKVRLWDSHHAHGRIYEQQETPMADLSAPRHFPHWHPTSVETAVGNRVLASFLNVSAKHSMYQVGGFIHLPDDIAIGDTFTVDGQLYPDPLTLRVVDVRQQSESTFPDSPQIYVYAEVASP